MTVGIIMITVIDMTKPNRKTAPKKAGRPKGPPTAAVTFRATAPVLEAIEKLTQAMPDVESMAPGSARAVAIRRAILTAAAVLDEDTCDDCGGPLHATAGATLAATSQHPDCVLEGFVRDDMMREYEGLPPGQPFEVGTVFLHRGVKPVVGAYVKAQITCKPTWNEEFKQDVTYALMGGKVHTVRDEKHVALTMSVTNMPAPAELDVGEWDVELELRSEYAHPWVVTSMRRWGN